MPKDVAAPWPDLDNCRGGDLTNPMLISAFGLT